MVGRGLGERGRRGVRGVAVGGRGMGRQGGRESWEGGRGGVVVMRGRGVGGEGGRQPGVVGQHGGRRSCMALVARPVQVLLLGEGVSAARVERVPAVGAVDVGRLRPPLVG